MCFPYNIGLFKSGEGTGNNYAYLVTDEKTKDAVIVDPANPSEYARQGRPKESYAA